MSANTFEIAKDAPISQVAQTMAGKRIGAAIIVDGDKPVGIFTTTDALRALAATLA
jgi:acetoin utilization protein AcuB